MVSKSKISFSILLLIMATLVAILVGIPKDFYRVLDTYEITTNSPIIHTNLQINTDNFIEDKILKSVKVNKQASLGLSK